MILCCHGLVSGSGEPGKPTGVRKTSVTSGMSYPEGRNSGLSRKTWYVWRPARTVLSCGTIEGKIEDKEAEPRPAPNLGCWAGQLAHGKENPL